MITFAFDESGKFEEGKVVNGKLSFIAGVLYDDKDDKSDKKNELERIQFYLKEVCKDAGTDYPRSLHFNADKSIGRSESVEKIFSKSFSEFLNKGTYKGKSVTDSDRVGEYHIFACIGTEEGKKKSASDNVLNSYGEYKLSSFYTYMATDLINHVIFHNPVLSCIKAVCFDLPTRSYRESLTEDERKKYGSRYGIKSRDGKDNVFVTDVAVYRTIIERELYYSDKHIDVSEIKCHPISYDNDKPDEILNNGFLYLSDLLCTVSCKDASGRGFRIGDISKIPAHIDTVCGKQSMTFFYDTTDTYYSKALEAIKIKDYKMALDHIYTGISTKSECSEYYKKKWFPVLIDIIKENVDADSFSDAVRKVKRYSLTNNIQQDRLIYLVKTLDEISEGLKFENDDEKVVLYDFYQVASTAYNHQAKTKIANNYIKKAEEYIRYVSLEQRLDLFNKSAVAKCDELDYSTAVLTARKVQKAWDSISEIRELEFNEKDLGIGARKAYSQLGQVYAFAEDSRAEYLFYRSIDNCNDPNAMITMSYLLHYYAEQEMKTKYDKLAKMYFGGIESLKGQLEYVVKEGTKSQNPLISMKFALYVYVRGIYTFHMQEVKDDPKLKDSLLDIESTLKKIDPDALKEINGHPWEMIYKYLALISLEVRNNGKAQEYMKHSEKILGKEETPDALLRSIISYGKLEYIEKLDNKASKKIKDATENCWKEICSISSKLEKEYQDPKKRTRDNLKLLMTYMYH